MTYESAFEWSLMRYPIGDYDTFEEWLEDIFTSRRLSNLEDSPTFNRMLEREWLDNYGSLDAGPDTEEEEYELPESRIVEIHLPRTEYMPRTKKELEVVLPQKYRSEQYKPTLENQVLQARELRIPYAGKPSIQNNTVTFRDRFKNVILKIFRGKK